jgi:hypothetical protein
MDSFGTLLAYVVVEVITLIEGTLAAWVDVTALEGNITNVALSPSGEDFCYNWSNLIVSFAGAMDAMMRGLSVVG